MNRWFTIARDGARMALDAQNVIALRMARFARAKKFDWAEARRMTAEKVVTLGQVQLAAALSMLTGGKAGAIASKTVRIYGKRVRANRRRLSRRKG